jgi:hypothetical protein
MRRLSLQVLLRLARGRVTRYGLPEPDHRLLSAHPTISDDLLTRLGHGDIVVKPNIERLDGDVVHFVDRTSERVDVIVYCTGYKITFPFLDEKLISADDNEISLYHRVVSPEHPGLFFIGLVQPLGAIMPLAEAQGRWVAAYLRGEYHLPSQAEMEADVARERERMFKRYVASKRHTMQVDFDNYLHALGKELKAGAARARRGNFTLPVTPRAERVTASAGA